MLTEVNYEVKGQLAKLLATEDLIIENRRVSTASFDVERRVLTLPMWEKASSVVYDLLVGHEVGHALYTPADNWRIDYPEVPPSFVNVFEDVRIEKMMKQKYPGLTKTFYNGYSQLAEQDFFELDSHELDEINLADRINIHYKIGNFTDVSFESIEQVFVDRAINTKTFKDVLELSNDLTLFLKEQEEQEKIDDISFGMDSGEGLSEPPSDGESTELPFDSEGEGGTQGKQEPSDQLTDDDIENYSQGIQGGIHGNMEAITDKTLQDNLENLTKTESRSHYEPEYVELPDLNLKTVVAKHSEVHEYLDDYFREAQDNFTKNTDGNSFNIYEKVDNDYRLFRRSAQKEVNYLVKEFECRKSADAYSRATVAKTGVLDCTKLHSYKYNEDLFKKITTLPDGKNHGLIFVLDWSGSMSCVLQDTVKQLFNLIWFCKKVQIPFQVFAFTNEWNTERDSPYSYDYTDSYKRPTPPDHHEYADGRIRVDPQFAMVEFVTSDSKKGDLERQMMNLWRLSSSMMGYRSWGNTCHYQTPRRLALSGTPLNEALVSLNQLIPEFQKKTGVQKVQCVTLTDGEAHPLQFNKWFKSSHEGFADYMGTRSTMSGKVYIRDRKVGKTYSCRNDHHELTSALLQQLRGRFPEVNFIGIRVMDSRDANSFIRRHMDWDFDKVQHIQAAWKKNKSLKLVDVGYHAYFGLSSSALNSDSEFTVKDDATKAQIKSAFKKSLSAKKMNKKVLGEFMEYIA
tara:strand:- start:394 stop:2613 length:2220 start_codon:yes stop_codon:yes gene_type:complete